MKGRGTYRTHNEVIEAWQIRRLSLNDSLMLFNVVTWESGSWNDGLHHQFWRYLLENAIGHAGRIHYGCTSSLDKENNTEGDYPAILRVGISVQARRSIIAKTASYNGYRLTAGREIWPQIRVGWDRTPKRVHPSLCAIVEGLKTARAEQEQSDREKAIKIEQLRHRRR